MDALPLAMDQDIVALDPHQHDDSVTHSVLSNVFDPLVTFDKEMKIVPALATSWENPTDLVWRFHLRPGVSFHDGRRLTASDVKGSLDRVRRGKAAHYLSSVQEVRVIDDLAVDIHTSKPVPVLLNKLTVVGIVPASAPEKIETPVGTGAYRFSRYEKGRFLELEANDGFWGDPPRIRMAVFKVLPDPAERAKALASGEILLAREVRRRDMARLPGGPPVKLLRRPGLAVYFLGVNFRVKGPLLERKVREAIFWALDRQEIIEEAGLEAAPIAQLVSPYVFGFLPEVVGGRPDLARAATLLAEAGHPQGLETTLEMSKAAAGTNGPAIARQLERVGILVRVVGLDWAELNSRLEKQESPFYAVGWSCAGDASDILDAVLHTRASETWGSANFGGYSNPKLDRLIEEAGEVLNPDRRLRVLQQAMKLSLEDLPLIPLYVRSRTYGIHESVRFSPRQDGQIILSEISWAK